MLFTNFVVFCFTISVFFYEHKNAMLSLFIHIEIRRTTINKAYWINLKIIF